MKLYDQDNKRAELVIEAFYFLDLPEYHLIDEDVVKGSFKKKALECHSNSPRVIAMDSLAKAKANMQWLLLKHANDVALGYLSHKEKFTRRCQETIKKGYDPKKMEFVTFDKLATSLHQPEKAEKLFLVHDLKRANLILEAFYLLDLPKIDLIDQSIVEQSFQKNLLACLPDPEGQKLLRHAKDIAMFFLKEKNSFGEKCLMEIRKKYDPENRATLMTSDSLKDSLEKTTTTDELFVF